MIKSFLILISISTLLFASEQIILVVGDDMNASVAKLECYEGSKLVYKDINVNIGKNGLGVGLGVVPLRESATMPLKKEGDKKAPMGVFRLSALFGYAQNKNYKMPYLHISEKLICVDDSNSKDYNTIIMAKGNEKSFEYMQRKDNQYKIGIVVQHNARAIAKRGSCIFIHIQKGKKKPTVGCTSMKEKTLVKIVKWLDKSKNPILIQIPKSLSPQIKTLYPSIKNSKLLQNGALL